MNFNLIEENDNELYRFIMEEKERQRRIKEDGVFTKNNLGKLIHTYQFQEEILNREKK